MPSRWGEKGTSNIFLDLTGRKGDIREKNIREKRGEKKGEKGTSNIFLDLTSQFP
jgi:hypothetical protein